MFRIASVRADGMLVPREAFYESGWLGLIRRLRFVSLCMQASPCIKAEQIAAAGIPLMLVAGWMDATAAAAISAYVHVGSRVPGMLHPSLGMEWQH